MPGSGPTEGEGEGEGPVPPEALRARLHVGGWSSPTLVSRRHRASLTAGRPVSRAPAETDSYRIEWRGVPRPEVPR